MRDDARNYRSLWRNMAAIVIAVSIAPLVLVVGVVLYQFDHMYTDRTNAHLVELVEKHRRGIDSFLDEKLRDIQFVADAYGHDRLADEAVLLGVLETLHKRYEGIIVDLGVIDSRGRQAAYAGPFALSGADYADTDWFIHALSSEQYVSDVFLGLRGTPHFVLAVKGSHQGEPWILRATIDFLSFSKLVESVQIGETGAAYILNRFGEFQTRPPAYVDGAEETAPMMPPVPGTLTGAPRVAEKHCSDGHTYLMVSAPLKGGDWELVYRQKSTDAFSPLIATERTALVILLLGGVCIAVAAVLVSRAMVRRIRRGDERNEEMDRQVVESGRLAAIGELAAGIAHEINNPVAIMIEEAGWVQDLLDRGEIFENDFEELRRSLRQIDRQGGRCKDITHKLLRFARTSDTRREVLDVNAIIADVAGLFQKSAGYANIKVSTKLGPLAPRVEGSASEMQQVLLNLVNNALQAMEAGGGELRLSAIRDAGEVVITVADTGPGISPANQPRIFDPFFTTKPVGKGTGLGLSICYGIVRRMGGRIDVESSPGEGTTFFVRLPSKRNGDVPGDAAERAGRPNPHQEVHP